MRKKLLIKGEFILEEYSNGFAKIVDRYSDTKMFDGKEDEVIKKLKMKLNGLEKIKLEEWL